MNGTDFLAGINSVDEKLINEAAESKRRVSPMRYILPAAACMALCLGALAALRFAKPNNTDDKSALLPDRTNAVAGITDAAAETAEPTAAPRIVYADHVESDDEFVPGPGSINMSAPLQQIIHGEAEGDWDDCLFAVYFGVTYADHGMLEKLIEEASRLNRDPNNQKYWYAYNEWYHANYSLRPPEGMTDEEIAAEFGCTYDEFWTEENDGLSLGYRILCAEFEKYWANEIPADEFRTCVDAKNRADEANRAAWGDRSAVWAEEAKTIAEEYERLKALGLNVYINENGVLCGYLTKEQLLDFPVSPEYGYYINWQGHDNVMDE